jgi:hypothetical protein
MSPLRVVLLALAAGALAGALVLGVGGRLLMAALVILAGGRPSFTAGGSLTVVAVGTGYGAVGGLLVLLLLRRRTGARPLAGALLGLLLLGVAWVTSPIGRRAAAGRLPLVLGLAVPAFVVWGLLATALLARWHPRRGASRSAAA